MTVNIEISKKYKSWVEATGSSDDWLSYIGFNIHPEDMLLVLKLVFPEFIVVDKCVFLKHKFHLDNYKEWKNNFSNQHKEIEKMINHTHLYDIFDQCTDHIDDIVFEEIGKILCRSWSQSLKLSFPNKNFSIDYSNSEYTYGPTLTFYQVEII